MFFDDDRYDDYDFFFFYSFVSFFFLPSSCSTRDGTLNKHLSTHNAFFFTAPVWFYRIRFGARKNGFFLLVGLFSKNSYFCFVADLLFDHKIITIKIWTLFLLLFLFILCEFNHKLTTIIFF